MCGVSGEVIGIFFTVTLSYFAGSTGRSTRFMARTSPSAKVSFIVLRSSVEPFNGTDEALLDSAFLMRRDVFASYSMHVSSSPLPFFVTAEKIVSRSTSFLGRW